MIDEEVELPDCEGLYAMVRRVCAIVGFANEEAIPAIRAEADQHPEWINQRLNIADHYLLRSVRSQARANIKDGIVVEYVPRPNYKTGPGTAKMYSQEVLDAVDEVHAKFMLSQWTLACTKHKVSLLFATNEQYTEEALLEQAGGEDRLTNADFLFRLAAKVKPGTGQRLCDVGGTQSTLIEEYRKAKPRLRKATAVN